MPPCRHAYVQWLDSQPGGFDADHRSSSRIQIPQSAAAATGQLTFTAMALRRSLIALATDHPLAARYRDRDLSGDWAGYRYCPIKPDLVLIYRKPTATRCARLGSSLTASSSALETESWSIKG